MKKSPLCLLLIVCCWRTLPAVAPTAGHGKEFGIPFFRYYSARESGGGVQNWSVAQDPRGVMYFANNAGVLEYDGVAWRLIPIPNSSAARALAVDADGTLYVGAQGELGYLAPDRNGGGMTYVSLRDSIPAEYRDFGDIAKCYATSAGIYFQALDRLFFWPRAGRLRVWKPALPFHLSFLVHDRLYIRQPEVGLLQLVGDSLQLAPAGERFAALRIYFMAPAGGNAILIGTREQGLFWYDSRSARPFPTAIDDFLTENQIYHGEVLSNGDFALGTLRDGVAIINRQGELQQLLNKAAGLPDENVRYLYSDRQGGLWLALNNGITRAEMPAPLSRFGELSGLIGGVEFIHRHRGRLYAATDAGVFTLQPFRSGRGQTALLLPSFQPVAGIASESWWLLSTGAVLLAAASDGVYEIDGEQARLVQPSEGHSFVLHRSRLDSTRFFVGWRDGLAAFRRIGNTWRDEGAVAGITEEIRSMLETDSGILWLGTRSQGYLRVDFGAGFQKNPRVEKFDSRHGLPENLGWGIVLGLDGRELFVTDQGIYAYEAEARRFVRDTTAATAEANRANATGEVLADAAGNLWMQLIKKNGSEIGVARRRPDGSYHWEATPFHRFADFTVWDIYPEATGVVWFGGPDGLVRYDTTITKNYAVTFTALIRRVVTIGGDSLLYGGARFGEGGEPPRLPYSKNSVRFEFAAPSFDDETATRYQYFLENFDKSWSEWTAETRKDYTNISEGTYCFRVRARNLHGQLSTEAGFAFTILPPWYRTWWAYGVYAGLAALAIYGLIKYRTRQLLQRSRELEHTVQQRTEQIRQQAEELETLDGIVRQINRELDLASVLRSLLEQGLKLFPAAEKASVLLRDSTTGLFKFAAAAGYDLNRMKDIAFTPAQLEQRYAAGAEEVGEGVYLVRNLQNLYVEEKRNAISTPISVLAMAAVWHGQIEAYLVFDNLSHMRSFSRADAHKLNRFRSHAVSAIIKAKILQELQQKNVEILRTQEQLIMQEKLASLGTLTAGIAHEIKNPLNFVNNFAVLSLELLDELEQELGQIAERIDPRTRVSLTDLLGALRLNAQKINEHGRRADGIVRGMLQHARAETGERESTELNVLVQQAVSLAYHGMRANEPDFNTALQEDYDPLAGRLEVVPQDLSRVLLNLLNNAFYAVHQKKKQRGDNYAPVLTVRTRSLGDKVEIRIHDNGTGIPPAVRDKIFNPFFTTKPPGEGTGLGLSISFDIIQKHRGDMRVETEEGRFTEFIITLPRATGAKV
ncbi:MAG: ATP-binding protein [candidate division KSB1 bacterium]|nr:ATP-binding protein [candidate division KSB1 bacterium]MDZ7273029.1 ATP-binding protein [candidate division KSB1 bacterium]MDZ7285132.1 ATP-binding protein [candidate division KSB1 bacterium]MDZ7298164.1 ATP-binding protein [candidate division KSB1 bacterium]MDZ7306918.1 ATP-binding protein [candidate division KSB1 bacterium]